MKVWKAIPKHGKLLPGLVLTIGVFDGVHTGHQAILKEVARRARRRRGTAAVLTFEGHPTQLISPQYSPPLLATTAQKLEWLEQAGMHLAMVLKFNKAFASIPAGDFVSQILVKRLGVRELVVGYDFVFGRQGLGTTATLQEAARRFGFKLRVMGPSNQGGAPVSSTRIRSAVLAGDMQAAAKLLGRPYQVTGRVIRGHGRGRLLGYPTANLATLQEVLPKPGVWGGRARQAGGAWRPFIANLGLRPTFQAGFSLELHLLDFEGSLYGKELAAEFLVYLRPEQRFRDAGALQAQIKLDEAAFRNWLHEHRQVLAGRAGTASGA